LDFFICLSHFTDIVTWAPDTDEGDEAEDHSVDDKYQCN